MAQFGSSNSYTSGNLSASQDPNGNAIISPSIAFGASPLGVAARTQTLYGIANANFDLTCADPGTAVTVDNAIPYWSLETDGTITTTMVYNETTQNWSVRIDPTGAETGDSAILKTRTYLLNDDALALRQKAFVSLTKQGTTGTAQWSVVLSATYFDEAGTQLSTYNIGTAADTGTWTGINGVTTSGSAAISTQAAYADIALTLTAAGSVSGTAKVDINSVLIGTSEAAAGGGGFLITERFTSSGTWTRPTGVDYVDVAVLSGGCGGGSGGLRYDATSNQSDVSGAASGGRGGSWSLLRNIYVGDVSTVTVGVGAGGVGLASQTSTKAVGSSGTANIARNEARNPGGASSFGTYLSVAGGGTSTSGTATSTVYGYVEVLADNSNDLGPFKPYTKGAPYTAVVGTAIAGGAGTVTTASITGTAGTAYTGAGGTAGTALGLFCQGGAQQGARSNAGTAPVAESGMASAGGGAGATGGAAAYRMTAGAGTITITAGNGANAVANTGSTGGGGASCSCAITGATNYSNSRIVATSGAGGNGGSGAVIVAWTA
ncbi:hypothetical protein UFOVP1573_36 [uncultured Caudovirales phage]|uniref:Glycine-rich domain-containing protein n=1 Tax=uncultured Caudovirales phage TaxID=2100421 RepID=A0A6J5QIN2_9CAUD|nr:hypothetical protein UFOVP1126_23 [uncultured Caudovirales phage]CAB4215459.1 hypothetical protein UFOVP1485_23 [uncultured Caudovirales phage]CAB5230558.1 hypothetical protein UFOVP1573_36 [uncultured Caudovirales phage]